MQEKTNVGARLGSMFLDHIIITFAIGIIVIPGLIIEFVQAIEISHQDPEFFFIGNQYIIILVFVAYFCKDIVGGRSPGKRITNLIVVDVRDGLQASPFKCLIRNTTTIFWPFEAFMALINPSRRMGDFIAGTRVVHYEESLSQPVELNKVIATAGFAYVVFAILFYPLRELKESVMPTQIRFEESSLNESLSVEIQSMLPEKEFFTEIDLKVFEKTIEHEGPFISAIIWVNRSMADHSLDEFANEFNNELIDRFESFNGHIKIVYERSNGESRWTRTLGSSQPFEILNIKDP